MKTTFLNTPIVIGNHLIVRIPVEISQLLTSRGFVIAKVTTQNNSMALPLEPDGHGSHWFECSLLLSTDELNIPNEAIEFELDTDVVWFPPEVPADFLKALEKNELIDTWETITVKAKWEWIRWVRSTLQTKTREGRINAACDKLAKGMKRPCCFDQSRCTVPELSKNGRLIEV